ncbi:MAG: metal dependent phosphohydrolase [Chthonomonadaceae bacterium]|nr:metal dependent phosphohydrolase [Chthonomonadaceae bacterium]
MSRQWIKDLDVGQKVDMDVRVVKAALHTAQNKSHFLLLTLADKTGEITGKQWNSTAKDHETLSTTKFARVVGRLEEYRGSQQVIFSQPPIDIGVPQNMSDFLICSPLPPDELHSRLHQHIASVHDIRLNALLRSIFTEDKEKSEAFMEYPAALGMHHAFRHGLLHHTLEVVDMVAAMADQQIRWGGHPVCRDLAVTGALLHDIGKVEEMQEQNFCYEFSEAGSLHGHIVQGAIYVTRKIAGLKRKRPDISFSKELEQMLIHLICSHHGKGEWGSPRSPMTAEAVLIHTADKASADLYYMEEMHKKAVNGKTVVKQPKLENGFGGQGRYVFVGDMGTLEMVRNKIDEQEEPLGFPIPSQFKLPILRLITTEEAEDLGISTRTLPLVGKIAAGQPLLHSDSLDGHLSVDASGLGNGKGAYYLLRVRGESMTGDGILDDDLIVVKKQDEADFGDLVVALLRDEDEGATVKRLVQIAGQVFLMPSNPAYPPIPVSDRSALQIQGRVIGIARSDVPTA